MKIEHPTKIAPTFNFCGHKNSNYDDRIPPIGLGNHVDPFLGDGRGDEENSCLFLLRTI